MTFKLQDPPLRYVVALFGVAKYPDITRLVGNAYEDLTGLGLTQFDKSNLQSLTLKAGYQPQVTAIEQNLFFDEHADVLVSIREDQVSVAVNNYTGFNAFSDTLSEIFGVLKKHSFPTVTSSTYRYVNEFVVERLPTDLLNAKFQGDVGLWGNSRHIHLDATFWIDLDEQGKGVWLKIKGAKGHKVQADNTSNLPEIFLSKKSATNGSAGLSLDLWHVSNNLKMDFDDMLKSELKSQRSILNEVFESVLTERSKKKWGYRKNEVIDKI